MNLFLNFFCLFVSQDSFVTLGWFFFQFEWWICGCLCLWAVDIGCCRRAVIWSREKYRVWGVITFDIFCMNLRGKRSASYLRKKQTNVQQNSIPFLPSVFRKETTLLAVKNFLMSWNNIWETFGNWISAM